MTVDNSYRYIYPEIHRSRVAMTYLTPGGGQETVPPDDRPVTFPDTCPACGAARTSETRAGFGSAQYACGGAYKSKPQIQNHTDKWWGSCPVIRALAKPVTAEIDTSKPPEHSETNYSELHGPF